jgi:hypothetical protein
MSNNINIFDVDENKDESKCTICLNYLNTEQTYVLPECNHKFHTNCIMTWMRSGNNRCPLCNNTGINDTEENTLNRRYNCWCSLDRFKMIKKYSCKKEAPKILKKEIEKIKIYEERKKENDEKIKNLKRKRGIYNELCKEDKKLRNKKWKISDKIHQMKMNIANYPIVNIIIPTIKNIKSNKSKKKSIKI